MWENQKAAALVLLLGLGAGGCAKPRYFLADQYVAPQSVAVLPVANETTDLDGPPYVRQLIFDALNDRGLKLIPLAEIDEKLRAEGFTDGGQLNATDPQHLGKWTGAESLLYVTLVNFSYINLGYYWQRKVTVFGRLVRAIDGEKLWEAEKTWMTLNVATSNKDAQKQFLTQVGVQALEKTMKVPLQPEARIAVKRMLDTLP